MECGPISKLLEKCCPPLGGVSKFNVDAAAKGKLDQAGIGGVLWKDKGEVDIPFSNPIGVKDSNEAKILANLQALRIYFIIFS